MSPITLSGRGALSWLAASLVLASPAAAATFVVDRVDDSAAPAAQVCSAAANDCSLRGAIIKANATPGADIVTFDPGTNGIPFTLTIANAGGLNEDLSQQGDLDVTESLTIQGNGSANTIIQAGTNTTNGIDKVLAINPFCNVVVAVTVDGVTIRHGRNTQPFGAADFSFTGGGVDFCGTDVGPSASSFVLSNSVVRDNTNTDGYGGGLNIDEVAPARSIVQISNTTIQGNTSKYTGGGINVVGDNAQVTIGGSTITGNTTLGGAAAGAQGGGINIRISNVDDLDGAPTPVVNVGTTTISNNTGIAYGGGISVSGSGNQDVNLQAGTVITGNIAQSQGALSSQGGGLYHDGDPARTTTLNGVTLSNNQALVQGGGAEAPEGGGILVNTGRVTLSGSNTINGNSAVDGGGIFVRTSTALLTLNPGTTVQNNQAQRNGGGLYVQAGTATLTQATVQGNLADSDSVGGGAGAGFYVNGGTLQATFSRIVNNTVGSNRRGLHRAAGVAVIDNNWWGCSSDPTAGGTPCDLVSGATVAKWLRVLLSGPAGLVTNQTSLLTASVNTNSSGENVSGNVSVLLGLPVAWSAMLGSLSGAQATLQPAGTATATFTALGAGGAGAAAVVDNDPSVPVRSNVVSITVGQASTVAAILSDTPDPTVTGQPFTVGYGVLGAFSNAPTAPTGSVMVSDGVDSCSGSVAAGSCSLTLLTVGARTLTATYLGDANFSASPASAGAGHTVDATAPVVTTQAATGVGPFDATLNASINPGGAATTAVFDYGTTIAYGSTTSGVGLGSGTGPVPHSAAIGGLSCDTQYHFRARATNSVGTTDGADLTFTTPPCPLPARVFVSVTGADTNDCSNALTPCRTIGAAILQVAVDGEIILTKSGSYAGATITKGVKLHAAPGLVAFSGQPMIVDAPGATVVIRGLTLKAVTPGTGTGILIQNASAVFVENTVIDGWAIGIQHDVPEVFIKDSTFRNNDTGIWATSGKTTIDASRFANNNIGVAADIGTVSLRGATVSGNTIGIHADASAVVTAEKCQIANNGTGVRVTNDFSVTVRLSRSVVTGNGLGLENLGAGALLVYGNNVVRGNTTDTSGTITTTGVQ